VIDLFSIPARQALREIARPGTLVVLDFDGTVAPLARHRLDARLTRRTRALLVTVAEARPTAVLSGRALPDLQARVAGVPLRWVVGSHGAEWPGEPPNRAVVARVRGWTDRLQRSLRGVQGIDLEVKACSLSIHWRGASDRRSAAAAAERAAASLRGARLIGGKSVINVVPAEAPDKGAALERLLSESGCPRVLVVGDDVTDEAMFQQPLPVPSYAVRVGHSLASGAGWFVRRRGDVDRLLALLAPSPPLTARRPPRRAGAGRSALEWGRAPPGTGRTTTRRSRAGPQRDRAPRAR
jgi:trehalose 6-phosphate phosphatase